MSVGSKWRTCLIAHPLLLLATAAVAQDAPDKELKSVLTPGSRVRLVSSSVGARLQGTVLAVDDKELTLVSEERPPLKVALSSIAELDLSMGRRRHWRRGLLIGAGVGLLWGAVAKVDEDFCDPDYTTNFCSRGEAMGGMTAASGLMGAGIGALFKSDRWAPVRLGRPGVGSDRKGFAVTVALSF